MSLFSASHEDSDTDLMTPPADSATRANGRGKSGEAADTGDHGLSVHLVDDEAGFDALEADWNELTARDSVRATMFQSYDWQRTWWRRFGSSYRLHILEIRKAGRLVALLPFCVERRNVLGIMPFRTLKFIGSQISKSDSVLSTYSLSDFLDIIMDRTCGEELVEAVLDVLDDGRRIFDRIELDELPEGGTFRSELLPEIQERGWSYDEMPRDVCPTVDLPGSMPSYLYELSNSVQKKYRRSARYVTKQKLYQVKRVESREEFASVFRWFVDLHQDRWHEQGHPGIFEDDRIRKFLEEAALAFLEEGGLRFSYAVDDAGRIFAVDFAFAYKKETYDLQRAFDPGAPLANKSPGWTLQYFLIRDAIESGHKRFHLLRGDYSYKRSVTNASPANRMIVLSSAAGNSSLKHVLWRKGRSVRRLRERLTREGMLIRIHYRQWGALKMLQNYVPFLLKRIRE